jgi:hypothetical protein
MESILKGHSPEQKLASVESHLNELYRRAKAPQVKQKAPVIIPASGETSSEQRVRLYSAFAPANITLKGAFIGVVAKGDDTALIEVEIVKSNGVSKLHSMERKNGMARYEETIHVNSTDQVNVYATYKPAKQEEKTFVTVTATIYGELA